jgi:hypothetical protein
MARKKLDRVPDHKVRYFWFGREEGEGWHIGIGMGKETLCHLPTYPLQIQFLHEPTFGTVCEKCKILLGGSAAARVVANPQVAIWS